MVYVNMVASRCWTVWVDTGQVSSTVILLPSYGNKPVKRLNFLFAEVIALCNSVSQNKANCAVFASSFLLKYHMQLGSTISNLLNLEIVCALDGLLQAISSSITINFDCYTHVFMYWFFLTAEGIEVMIAIKLHDALSGCYTRKCCLVWFYKFI